MPTTEPESAGQPSGRSHSPQAVARDARQHGARGAAGGERTRDARLGPVPLFWARAGVWLLGLLPLVRWLVLGFTGGLGANPPEFLIRSSGTFTLVALLLTLAVSPLRWLTGNPAWLRLRRLFGLFTFFYACLHLLGYAWWDQGFNLTDLWRDALQRPLIAVGWMAWALLLALAVTSTRGWMRRLGRRWQTLHRAIYVVACLALLHFWLHRAGKNDFGDVLIFAAVAVVLLGWRLWRRWS